MENDINSINDEKIFVKFLRKHLNVFVLFVTLAAIFVIGAIYVFL